MNIFTYGSLMFPAVWDRLLPGPSRRITGTIRGYARVRIANEVYPGLIEAAPDSSVTGVVYLDRTAADVERLDRFESEGEVYRRITVAAELEDGRLVDCWAYLFLCPERVDSRPWSPERFEALDLRHFLDEYRGSRSA